MVIKVQYQDNLQLQFLVSSGYSLNVVVKDLCMYSQALHDSIFAVLLTVICLLELVGAYHIFAQIYRKH